MGEVEVDVGLALVVLTLVDGERVVVGDEEDGSRRELLLMLLLPRSAAAAAAGVVVMLVWLVLPRWSGGRWAKAIQIRRRHAPTHAWSAGHRLLTPSARQRQSVSAGQCLFLFVAFLSFSPSPSPSLSPSPAPFFSSPLLSCLVRSFPSVSSLSLAFKFLVVVVRSTGDGSQ